MRARRVVRRYSPEPVAPDALERIVDAFRRGPSAGFSQGVHLVVVTDAADRTAIAHACGEPEAVARGLPRWLSVAPVHLLPCVAPEDYRARYAEEDKAGSVGPDGWEVPFWWVDAGAAWMLASLAAVDEGLATGFCDIADRAAVADLLGLPDGVVPVGLVTLGHGVASTSTSSLRRGRRPVGEVVHDGRWAAPWAVAADRPGRGAPARQTAGRLP